MGPSSYFARGMFLPSQCGISNEILDENQIHSWTASSLRSAKIGSSSLPGITRLNGQSLVGYCCSRLTKTTSQMTIQHCRKEHPTISVRRPAIHRFDTVAETYMYSSTGSIVSSPDGLNPNIDSWRFVAVRSAAIYRVPLPLAAPHLESDFAITGQLSQHLTNERLQCESPRLLV